MLWFKACPRCATGTVEARSDSDGRYLMCLSCAWTLYAPRYGRVGAADEPLLAASKKSVAGTPQEDAARKAA